MKYPKLRELKEAVTALVRGPYTLKFPKEPSPAAKRYRGKPEYHEGDCVGCGACFEVCPSRAIEMDDTGYMSAGSANKVPRRKLTVRYDHCIFCGQCQASCITEKGIMLSNEYNLATFDRTQARDEVEKELILCSDCKTPIGCKDHLIWLYRKLGPLAFSNPVLFLSSLEN